MTTTQNIQTEVEWVDTTGYLAVGTTMHVVSRGAYIVSVVQEPYLRIGWTGKHYGPETKEQFFFTAVDEDTFMMTDEDGEELGLVTDVRKAAFEEWEARELARAEAYDF